MEILKLILLGLIIGGAASAFKLPVPAPPTISGVIGILAITLGYIVTNYILGR